MKEYRKYLIRSATQQVVSEADDTGVITIGATQTPSAAGSITLLSISVPAGALLLVSEIDVFSSASATFLASYSYSVGGQTIAGAKYYYLAAAGFLPDVQSIEKPIISMLNLSANPQTFTITVPAAAASTLYGANIRYAIV